MLTMQSFDPKPATEVRQLAFDFELAVGETITGQAVSCSVWTGVDPSPSSVVGTPTASGAQVLVVATGGVAGAIYLLRASATTNLGQTLVREGLLAIGGVA